MASGQFITSSAASKSEATTDFDLTRSLS